MGMEDIARKNVESNKFYYYFHVFSFVQSSYVYTFLLRSSFLLLDVLDMCRITCLYLRACDSRNIIFVIHCVRRPHVPVEASSCLIIIQEWNSRDRSGHVSAISLPKSSTTRMYCLFRQKTTFVYNESKFKNQMFECVKYNNNEE